MILYLLWVGTTIFSSCFSMQKDTPIAFLLPADIITKILTIPFALKDQQHTELFKSVKKIQNTHNFNDKSNLKKYFNEIQIILFPTFGLAQTCKSCYALNVRTTLVENAKQTLFNELPQGILFFILPKKIQNELFEKLNQKILNDLNEKYQKPDIRPRFYDSFGENNYELNTIIYYKENETLNSRRVIEYIITTLKPHLTFEENMVLNVRDMLMPNFSFLLILNHICNHNVVDLRIPVSDGSCSTAQYINDSLHAKNKPEFFKPITLAKILDTYEYPSSTFEYPKEKKEIIEHFIAFYFNVNQAKSD